MERETCYSDRSTSVETEDTPQSVQALFLEEIKETEDSLTRFEDL